MKHNTILHYAITLIVANGMLWNQSQGTFKTDT